MDSGHKRNAWSQVHVLINRLWTIWVPCGNIVTKCAKNMQKHAEIITFIKYVAKKRKSSDIYSFVVLTTAVARSIQIRSLIAYSGQWLSVPLAICVGHEIFIRTPIWDNASTLYPSVPRDSFINAVTSLLP